MIKALLLSLTTAHAAEIVVAGDSWGQEGRFAFHKMFASRGHNVSILNVAKGGSHASDWAKWGLKQHLSADTKHVWLSVGGNDAQRALPGCGLPCVPKLVNNTIAHILAFVKPTLAAFPNVQIVMAGYDILNFGLSERCYAEGLAFIPQCLGGIECFNSHFTTALQHGLVEGAAAKAGPRLIAVDIRGTLQKAGGVAGADIGTPVLSKWSPKALMQTNCIHPTYGDGGGFVAVMDALWATYFHKYYPATGTGAGAAKPLVESNRPLPLAKAPTPIRSDYDRLLLAQTPPMGWMSWYAAAAQQQASSSQPAQQHSSSSQPASTL